jgi:hypothetical protein
MQINKLICPHCNDAFPIFVKPTRWIMKKWYKSPDAKCPSCENIFQIKISIKRFLCLLPIMLCFMVLETELIRNHLFEQNLTVNTIAGALAGLIAGIGIRLSYVVKYE